MGDLFVAVLDLHQGDLQVGQLLPQGLDAVQLVFYYARFQVFRVREFPQGLFPIELHLVNFVPDSLEFIVELLMRLLPGGLLNLRSNNPGYVLPPRFNELPLGKIPPLFGGDDNLLLLLQPLLPPRLLFLPLLHQLLFLRPNFINQLCLQPNNLLLFFL